MDEKRTNFGDFLAAAMGKAIRENEQSHRHLDEFYASLKTEAELAKAAGACATCMMGAVTKFMVDMVIDLNPKLLTDSDAITTKVPKLADDLAMGMFRRILERMVEAKAKEMNGTQEKTA